MANKSKDYTIVALLIPFTIAVLFNLPSCESKRYSPLDTYCNTLIQKSIDSTRHAVEVERFLDSVGVHLCVDRTHKTCDGLCECDGFGCAPLLKDYQLELWNDTVWIYEGKRLVGRYTSNWKNQFDSIILNDNQ